MKPVGASLNVHASHGALYRRRVEKLHAMSGLNGKPQGAAIGAMLNPNANVEPPSSRFETRYIGRVLENGIPAGFIAQILGQISETIRPDTIVALRAYAPPEEVKRRFIRFL